MKAPDAPAYNFRASEAFRRMEDIACRLVLEAAGVGPDLSGWNAVGFAAAYPNLVTFASLKAIALAWTYGTGGQAMPPGVQRYEDLANQALELLATRRRQTAAPESAAEPQGVGSYAAPQGARCRACLGQTANTLCERELVASREAVRRLWCHVQAVNPAGLDRQSSAIYGELRREVEALARVAGVA